MYTLAAVAVVFGFGALITVIGKRIIERAHRPQGRFIELGGARQHVMELGRNGQIQDGRPSVVLLHGAGANLEDMHLALGERLAAAHRVILVDRPGFGFSLRKGGQASSPTYQAMLLREVLNRLGVDRAILVGHSWGGSLALTFALDHPQRVVGLVLICAPTHPALSLRLLSKLNSLLTTPVGWLFAHTLALPLGAIFIHLGSRASFRPQHMPRHYVKRSAAMLVLRPLSLLANWADVGGLHAFLARQAGRYGELSEPIIALGGDRDFLVRPQNHAAKLAAAAPVVKLELLPGFGHMLHHAAGDRVAAAVAELAARDRPSR